MNTNIYKSFKAELEKQAGFTGTVGKGVSKTMQFAWKHPKSTIVASLAAMTLPKLIKMMYPSVMMGTQFQQNHMIGDQTGVLKEILEQERQKNVQHKPLVPVNKLIHRPLV